MQICLPDFLLFGDSPDSLLRLLRISSQLCLGIHLGFAPFLPEAKAA